MDKRRLRQVDMAALPNGPTPVASRQGDHAQSSVSASSMQPQPYIYDPNMAHNMYQQQHFDLRYPPTQNLGLLSPDSTQAYTEPAPKQSIFRPALPPVTEQSTVTAVTSTASISQDHVPRAKRRRITSSVHSVASDGEEHSTHEEPSKKRKDRRRAQNRAAQRAFRARKEETIKESSTRLDALQEELARLRTDNSNLSETINNLRTQITDLERENAQLKAISTESIEAG